MSGDAFRRCGERLFPLKLVALGDISFSALAIESLAEHRSLSSSMQRSDRLEIFETGYSALGAETRRVNESGGPCSQHAERTTPTEESRPVTEQQPKPPPGLTRTPDCCRALGTLRALIQCVGVQRTRALT